MMNLKAGQAGDDAEFDSGGGDATEEQLWHNHPDQRSDDSPPKRSVQSPGPPEAPEEAPEKDDGLGRV